jgi:hypothetical protein
MRLTETPRIFAQGLLTLGAGTTSFDQSQYASDGDYVCRISTMLIDSSFTAPDEPWIIIKPTNAPNWNRTPLAPSLLMNLLNVPQVFQPGPSVWLLENPTYLGMRDALDISALSPGHSEILGISFIGTKLIGQKETPRPFRSPRILYTQTPANFGGNGIATGGSATLNVEDLRNWGDRVMHVHRIVFQIIAGNGANPIGADVLRVRIQSSKYGNWIGKNKRVTVEMLQDGLTASILVGDVAIDPDEALIVEVAQTSGATCQVKCAVVGSVEV